PSQRPSAHPARQPRRTPPPRETPGSSRRGPPRRRRSELGRDDPGSSLAWPMPFASQPGSCRRSLRLKRRGALRIWLRPLDGKANRERRSLALGGPVDESASHLFHDLPAHEQAKARAMRLGREERLEEPAAVRQRDASAVVLDGQLDPAAIGPGSDGNLPPL